MRKPFTSDELDKIRAWQNGGPPPSMVVNVERWMDTVTELQESVKTLNHFIKTLTEMHIDSTMTSND